MAEVAAIVLAAGLGRRFGAGPDDSKVFALLDGKPLLAHAVAAVRNSRASPIIVVTGHAAPHAAAAIGPEATIVYNPDYRAGLSASLKAGLAALPTSAEAVLILLGDMPLVQSRTLDRLIACYERERPEVVVPVYEGRWGNPMLLCRSLEPDLMALSGDRGARKLAEVAGRRVVGCVVDDPHVLTDIDTPAMLAEVAGSAERSAR